jgi:hypothetical protein
LAVLAHLAAQQLAALAVLAHLAAQQLAALAVMAQLAVQVEQEQVHLAA